MRTKLAFLILSFCVNSGFGQTVSDVEMKYGAVNAYSVSEHIWMTAEYTSDGRVCQMQLYPKRISPNTVSLSKQLPFEELKGVLNRLAPPDTRGMKKESFGITETGAGAAWTTYPYERVTFTFTFSLRVDSSAMKESKSYDFSVDEFLLNRKPEMMAPSDNDFSRSQTSGSEIVTLKWNDRKCAGK